MLMAKSSGADRKVDDLFENPPEWADTETDASNDLLEKWLRLAEAALKKQNGKHEVEKDKEVPR